MTDRATLVEKIAKLKIHAESAQKIGSETEALSFAAMASRLMSEHAILEHEIRMASASAEVDEKIVKSRTNGLVPRGGKRWERAKTRVLWMEQLARVVATAHFCRNVVITGSAQQEFVGREGDAEMAVTIFTYMAELAANLADRAYNKAYSAHKKICDRPSHKDDRCDWQPGYHRSYLDGFSGRLGERYAEETEKMKTEWAKNGTALVRLTDGLVKVNEFIDDKENGFKNARNLDRGDFNSEAHAEGRDEADRIKLKNESEKLGSGAKALKG